MSILKRSQGNEELEPQQNCSCSSLDVPSTSTEAKKDLSLHPAHPSLHHCPDPLDVLPRLSLTTSAVVLLQLTPLHSQQSSSPRQEESLPVGSVRFSLNSSNAFFSCSLQQIVWCGIWDKSMRKKRWWNEILIIVVCVEIKSSQMGYIILLYIYTLIFLTIPWDYFYDLSVCLLGKTYRGCFLLTN